MTVLFTGSYFTIFDSNGSPVSGAKCYFYEAGTSTPLTTYSDSALTVENTHPVLADASGRLGTIFLAADNYKVYITDSEDNEIDTQDDFEVVSPATFTSSKPVNAQTGTSYTIKTTDRSKLLTLANVNAISVTLPQADSSNFPDGWYVDIYNKGTGTATITPNTSTIGGLATYTMRADEVIRVVSDGTNYQLGMVGGQNPAVNAQTGTSYATVTGDRGKLITLNNIAAVAVSLPEANTTTFKSGWSAEYENIGAGVVTITPTTSTINGGESTLVLTRGQRAKVTSDGTNYQSVVYGVAVGSEMTGYSATAPQGWLVQNGETIGSAASGADHANAKYRALYKYIWDSVDNAYAAVSSGRGGSADADFDANKTLTIPTMADMSPYGVGAEAAGETAGASTVASSGTVGTTGSTALSEANLPTSITATMTTTFTAWDAGTTPSPGATDVRIGGQPGPAGGSNSTSVPLTLNSVGSGTGHAHPGGTYTGNPTSVLHPVRGKYFYIKY